MVAGREPGLGRAGWIALLIFCILPLTAFALGMAAFAGMVAADIRAFRAGAEPVEARVEESSTSRTGTRAALSVTELRVTFEAPHAGERTGRVTLGLFSARPVPGEALVLLWNPEADPPLRPVDPLALWGDCGLVAALSAALAAFTLWATALFAARRRKTRLRAP